MMASPTAQPTVSQIREVEMAGERFIRQPDGSLLVASKSEPNVWHRIENAHCDCKGFFYRGVCSHVTAAAQLSPAEVRWSDQFGAWLVYWGPVVHGGCHFNRHEADEHAARLASDPGYSEWLQRHGYGTPSTPPSPTRREPITFPAPKSYAVPKETML